MSKKFEYNFTNENELIQLRERIGQLQEQNNLLKQSLEELIKVNTELTESIEQFNNQNMQSDYQNSQIRQMVETIEILNSEIDTLRREIDNTNRQKSKASKKVSELVDEQQTESLVNVLEELIESFKNMQSRYDGEIQELNKTFEQYKTNYQYTLKKLQEDYRQKMNTLEPVIMQLQRKDSNLNNLQERVYQIEKNRPSKKQNGNQQSNYHLSELKEESKRLQDVITSQRKTINIYQNLLDKLKVKFNEKL